MLSRFHLRDKLFDHIGLSQHNIFASDQMQKKGYHNRRISLAMVAPALQPIFALLICASDTPYKPLCDLGSNDVG